MQPGLFSLGFLLLCVVVFGLQQLALANPPWGIWAVRAYEWGAFYAPAIAQGEWWRLATFHFLHAGWGHLLNNMIGLYIYGALLEGNRLRLGWPAMGLLFVAAMGATDLASWWWVQGASIGASGVVYGLMAGFLVLSVRQVRLQTPETSPAALRSLLVYSMILLLVNVTGPGNINIWGHFGGFVGGAVFGLFWPLPAPLSVSLPDQLLDPPLPVSAAAGDDEPPQTQA
ncbi:MAG: rhomboid family intramembrane serine protease [Vampirovibrionales bacterium]